MFNYMSVHPSTVLSEDCADPAWETTERRNLKEDRFRVIDDLLHLWN